MHRLSVLAAASTLALATGIGTASASVHSMTADRTGCSNTTAYIYSEAALDCFGKGSGPVEIYEVDEIATANACLSVSVNGTPAFSLGPNQSYTWLNYWVTITYVAVTGCAST